MVRSVFTLLLWGSCLSVLGACAGGGGSGGGGGPVLGEGDTPYPIMFVTQVPIPYDYLTVASTFGNHLGRPNSCARGGDLYIRYPDGTLKNLTAEAGYGKEGLQTGNNSIAVREPTVHWNGTKAIFSMVKGSSNDDTVYFWQLYEVLGLGKNDTPHIVKVPNQPADANNVSPCYASDGRILFVSDRPRSGEPHLYPQLDEYESAPTNTGIWSLDRHTGELFMMNHSPSGSFTPLVDSFGRVVFTRWDHLERDQQADDERMGAGNYGTFNYSDESANAFDTGSNYESFPEPRKQWIDYVNNNPDYNGPLAGWEPHLVGNPQNFFLPWTLNQDGTVEETLNHIGRHELHAFGNRSFNDDPNLVDHYQFGYDVTNENSIEQIFQMSEDPLVPGLYYGIDGREFDTHASGQLVAIYGPPGVNPNQMWVSYVTHRDTQAPTLTPGPNHSGFYRNPIRLSSGELVASHTPEHRKDENIGTYQNPRSRYDLRLKLLTRNGDYYAGGIPLTPGIHKSVTYYNPYDLITYDGEMWELDPVEVAPRPAPPPTSEPSLELPELQVLAEEGVTPAALRQYLESQNLALLVSRDLTTRDKNDRTQPFNLKVHGTNHKTVATSGEVYHIQDVQFFQGDQVRGLTFGGPSPVPGRRVLAQKLHDPAANNPPNPGGPPGSVKIAEDGSMAALVPARRAMSWQTTDDDWEPVVRERFWVSFQPGEIRTCASCHGVNEINQVGDGPPQNPPDALNLLLQHLKSEGAL